MPKWRHTKATAASMGRITPWVLRAGAREGSRAQPGKHREMENARHFLSSNSPAEAHKQSEQWGKERCARNGVLGFDGKRQWGEQGN